MYRLERRLKTLEALTPAATLPKIWELLASGDYRAGDMVLSPEAFERHREALAEGSGLIIDDGSMLQFRTVS